MIAIVDYEMGNLASVSNALAYLGIQHEITQNPERIVQADKVILPGVGAFADAIRLMRKKGLDQAVQEVGKRNIPLLGICLGMHLLFTESYEDGIHQGLNLIPGKVIHFSNHQLKVPHMGWNTVNLQKQHPWGLQKNILAYFYFVHSYYVVPDEAEVILGTTLYGQEFVSAVACNNIWATQFHPEKSGVDGLTLIRTFGAD